MAAIARKGDRRINAMAWGSEAQDRTQLPLQAEARAVLLALKMAEAEGWGSRLQSHPDTLQNSPGH